MSVITTEKETQISFDYALAQQIVQLNIQDEALDGRMITVNGCPMINFGNCSYLGLELHPAIKAGVMLMTQRYGSLYASSRSYVGLGIFEELEDLMEQIFGGPTLMATCTTMGHLGVIPVLVGPHDVVIMDQQVHASVQMAVSCLKGSNPAQQVEKIKHNNLAMLENRIQKLSVGNNKIWYMVDGVYSMFGDVAPIPEILELMDRYDNLYLYCDDAHGMSWTGRHGAGFFRSRCAYHPRVVLSTSLGKGFGAAGGTFTFPNQEMKHKVRSLGGTFIFAAPLSPPLLGACLASARIHLSDELAPLQAALRVRIDHFVKVAQELKLPLAGSAETPVQFVVIGKAENAVDVVKRLHQRGFYVNMSAYPIVPQGKGGLRITLTNHLSLNDLSNLAKAVREELDEQVKLVQSATR